MGGPNQRPLERFLSDPMTFLSSRKSPRPRSSLCPEGPGPLALLALVGAWLIAPLDAAKAANGIDLGVSMTAAQAQLPQQRLAQLIQEKLRGAPPNAIDRATRGFLEHLRSTSPLAAEQFATEKWTTTT